MHRPLASHSHALQILLRQLCAQLRRPNQDAHLYTYKAEHEFTHMRYSAATGDPNDFKHNGFMLRQVHCDPQRRTELFIVMTMYNEDNTLFVHTMHGVTKNIAYLYKRDRSKTWGKDGWKKVVVCVEDIVTNVVNGKPVSAHIYYSDFAHKFWIHVELIYQTFNLIFSWFALGNFFISFFVLTNALEDPTILGGKGIELFNTLLKYSYVGLLLTCFILSLGNRPQGSNKGYTLAFVGFALFTVYITFAAIFLAVKGVQQVAAEKNRGATFSDLFTNAIFCDIVISISATVGLYVLASIIHARPSIFGCYTLLAPSYINILNVYAFANVHDVSWGTKGDNKVSTDLGVVKASKGENAVEVAVPTAETDINAAYEDAIHVLSTKPLKEEKKEDAATKQEDYCRNFRTNVLLAWVLSNALLVAVVLTTNGSAKTSGANSTVNGYLIFILYSVALLAFVRFVGSTAYMIIRLFAGE
ncbi:hypothetical protein EDB85DRAFT_2143404 [Lactarius pseudohatsudake]|nr:hypothetical protein EDB85DRAFT_2143404 [Lactarius pseudohatsudake]